MTSRFWYAVAAAVLYGAHQIFTRLMAERIGEGLGGFIVEASAALSILIYLAVLWFGGRWNQKFSGAGFNDSLLTGICVGAGTIAFFLLSKRRPGLFCSRDFGWWCGNYGYRRYLVFPRSTIMAAHCWHCVRHHWFVFAAQIVSEASKLRCLRGIPRIISISVMM
jgi:hypothetical protein